MLRSTMLITLAIAFAAPATAGGPSALAVGTFEGEQYEYTTRLAEKDKVLIEGKFVKRGEQFSYVVKPSGRVEGFVGNTAVTFQVPRATHARISAELKAGSQPTFAEAQSANSATR